MNKSQSLFTTLVLGGLLAAGTANGQTNTVPTNYAPPFDAAAAGLKPLFDGKTLNGWVGDPTCWKVADGAIVGVKGNQNLRRWAITMISASSSRPCKSRNPPTTRVLAFGARTCRKANTATAAVWISCPR